MRSSIKLTLGTILVVVGVLFLGSSNNFWHFSWNWLYVGLFGTTLQIILGLWLLLPKRQWRAWVAAGVVLLVFAAIVLIPEARARFIGESSITRPASTVSRLELKIDTNDVDVTVGALDTNSSSLYTATAQGFRLNERITSKDDAAQASLTMIQQPFGGATRTLYSAINPRVPLALEVEINKASAMLDLRKLTLERLILDCDNDNTDTTIMLGERNATQRVEMDCDNAAVNVRIPQGVALQLLPAEAGEPLNGDYASLGLERKGNTLTSPGFDATAQRIVIVLEDDTDIVVTRY
ncbi:MAG TPA: hypothetical protein VJM32_01235 [Candidatus Saccharimonadales bacterium]|nr:hypothetical protein [Candidatus Saccharimonadales bacterium]